MATVTNAQLVAPQRLPTADTVLYTTPANVTAKIGRAVVVNTSASPVTFSAGITTGVAMNQANMLISSRTVSAGEAYVCPELAGAVIPAGSVLRTSCQTANALTFTASGITIQ